MHGYRSEMQGCRTFPVLMGHLDHVAPCKQEYREDSLIALSSTVHDCLISESVLVGVTPEVKH